MTALSMDQVEAYGHDGYVFPLDVMSEGEARTFRAQLEAIERRAKGEQGVSHQRFRAFCHLLMPCIDQLMRKAAIVDPVESILGPDLDGLVGRDIPERSKVARLCDLASGLDLLGARQHRGGDGLASLVGRQRRKRLHALYPGIAPLRHRAPQGHLRRCQHVDARPGDSPSRSTMPMRSTSSCVPVRCPCTTAAFSMIPDPIIRMIAVLGWPIRYITPSMRQAVGAA